MTEEKYINGFENLYSIDTNGNVFSLYSHGRRRDKKHRLSWTWDTRGFPNVSLHKGGHGRKLAVHRLVYETFIRPIPKKKEVYHINGIKSDNRVENLAVRTIKERDTLGASKSIFLMEADYPYREFSFLNSTQASRFFGYKEKTTINTYIFYAMIHNRDVIVIKKKKYYFSRDEDRKKK